MHNPTFGDILLLVQRHNGRVVHVDTGVGVDEMGASVGLHVIGREVEGVWSFVGPRLKVAHYLVFLCTQISHGYGLKSYKYVRLSSINENKNLINFWYGTWINNKINLFISSSTK